MMTVYLPLKEAIDLAAKENFERDYRLGLEEPSETVPEIYYEEASCILKSTKENYEPEFPDHHMIYVI